MVENMLHTLPLFRNIRGDSCGRFRSVIIYWKLLKSLHPLCWTVPEQDAESLPAYRVAYSDLCLLWRRAHENDKFSPCINPSSGKHIWRNCPFKFESCYVSGSTNQPGISAQSVHLLLALSRTSLAPACFASITIYQVTIKGQKEAEWHRALSA